MFQLFVIITLSWCEHGSDLHGSGLSFVAIRNNEDSGGLEITILNHVNNAATNEFEEQQSQIYIPGHSLSSGCGEHYFRCQNDLVVKMLFLQNGREFEVIFIPLDSGILLLSHWCDSNRQRVPNCTWNTALANNSLSNCSPTVIYNINSKLYMVCMSSASQYISVYASKWNSD